MMSSSKPIKQQVVELPRSWQPKDTSIICGRGRIALEHKGNQDLRALVTCHMANYSASRCKFQKSKIVSEIVETVRRASPGGGFVKFVDDGWVEVSDRHAREKVGQMFRDCLHIKYKSSTRSKAKSRRSKASVDETSQASSSDGCDSSCLAAQHQKNIPTAARFVDPLPERPPSMLRIESLSAPIGNSLDNLENKMDKSMLEEACTNTHHFNPLNLSNFEPAPIDEATMNELFDHSFPALKEPLPFASNSSSGEHPSMENLSHFLFGDFP